MDIDRAFSLALAAAIVNVVLSTIVPCLTKHMPPSEESDFFTRIRVYMIVNRHMLLTSSLVTAILVYLAVKIEPDVKQLQTTLLNFVNQ